MSNGSRISGFYRQKPAERQRLVQERCGLTSAEIDALTHGGLTLELADRLIENVVGVYDLPLGVAANFQINQRDLLIPMVIEEPSVVAGASHAAKLVRDAGGFTASADASVMIGQVQVVDIADLDGARQRVLSARNEILAIANARSTLTAYGGGAREIEVRTLQTRTGPMLVVSLLVDTRDAMGANSVNSACEAVAPLLEERTGGRVVLRILSNLADRRLARANCRVLESDLGADLVRAIVQAQALAEADPYRAATHNKGILNGIDAVVIATGNDWRNVEAGAHAYASRSGRYSPLSRWDRDANGDLVGSIELPIAVGTVGGTASAHPAAQVALKILQVTGAQELAGVLAAVGLAQNLAALRALAGEGIQHGHMALHARQVAMAAGAAGEQIDRIAARLVEEDDVRLGRARELLDKEGP